MSCKDCSHARCKAGVVRCRKNHWFYKTYPMRSVIEDRVPVLLKIFSRCADYSPPTNMEVELWDKSTFNRRKIARIIEAVRDGRKRWSYDEPPHVKDAYWMDWE